jgi:hypothetical protein
MQMCWPLDPGIWLIITEEELIAQGATKTCRASRLGSSIHNSASD